MRNTAMDVVIPATSFNSQEWSIQNAQLDPNESHTYLEIQAAVLAASQDGLPKAAADAGVSVATLQKWIANPVDVYNMAIAFGMTYNSDYAQRLNAQLEEVKANTEDLGKVNKVLDAALSPETWDADPVGFTAKAAEVGLTIPLNTVVLGADNFPSGTPTSLYGNYHWPPPPAGPLVTGLYTFRDGSVAVTYQENGIWTRAVVKDVPAPSSLEHPSPEDLAAVQSSAQDLADTLTQTSQLKQAFTQELMAKIDQFLKFATNILEKASRVKEGILSKIG